MMMIRSALIYRIIAWHQLHQQSFTILKSTRVEIMTKLAKQQNMCLQLIIDVYKITLLITLKFYKFLLRNCHKLLLKQCHSCLNDYMIACRNLLCVDMNIFWNCDTSISQDIDISILYTVNKMFEKTLLKL